MTTTEKIAHLRSLSGLNQNRFSKLVGIAPSTMTRLERGTPNQPSVDTLQKIADTFEGVSVAWLEDADDEQLPAILTVRGSASQPGASEKEGPRLRRFVERHKPTLNQSILGSALGVSRNQVSSYYNTTRFRESVLNSLLAALSKLLARTVTADEVFGSGRSAAVTLPTNLVAVPRLAFADRAGLTPRFAAELHQNFAPAIRPDSALYAPKSAVTSENLKRAFAIEIGPSDHMEPLYFPRYWVLGLQLDPAEFSRFFDGIVGVLTTDGEFLLRKVIANNLRTTGILELGAYTVDRGGTIQLRKTDVQLMFGIQGIIYGITS